MRRVIDLLAPLGAIVVLGATVWQTAGKTLPGKESYYLAAGAALILTHLILRWDDVVRLVGRRQMKYGANALVQVLVVLALLVGAYWIVKRNNKRWDVTKGERYSLSDQTKKVLANLKDDVTIWYFQREANLGEGRDRLELYKNSSSKLKLNFVDPIAKPAQARAFDITTIPTLVVERAGKREKINNDSEQDVTNALIKVTREGKRTVCFTEGEGERDIEDFGDPGFSGVKGALSRSQYETQKVLLLREGKVPDTCTVLVMAGPQKDPLPQVIEAIRSYVKGGGKALLLLEPGFGGDFAGLVGLLKEFDIEAGHDEVLDVSLASQLAGTGPETPLAARYPQHEITKDFRLATAFHSARSMKAGSASIPGVSAQNLVETSPDSWAETSFSSKGGMRYDEGADTRGPVSLGAVATFSVSPSPTPGAAPSPAGSPVPEASPSPSPSAEPEPKREGRLVAIGDADFASNAFLSFPGNQDFFLNSVAWLSQDVDLISIRPHDAEDQRLFLSAQQQRLVALTSMILLPGLFIVLGVASWWRRRG